MNLKFSDYKANARATLDGSYQTVVGSVVILLLLVTVLSAPFSIMMLNATSYVTIVTGIIANLIITLLATMLFIGLKHMHLSIARGYSISFKDLFYAFKNQSNQLIKIALFFTIINYVFQIPRLIWAAIGTNYTDTVTYYVIFALLHLLWGILFLIVLLNHATAFELCLDHYEYNVSDALRQSRQMMKGHRLYYLGLHISFIGLYILGLLSLGIGFLWLIPYVVQTQESFYLNLTAYRYETSDDENGGR